MIVLGVVLVVLAAVMLLVALLAASDNEVQFDLGFMEGSLSALSIFLLGAATVLIFVCGLELLRSGTRRSLRRRRELKQARAVTAEHDRREQPATSEQTSTGSTSTSSTGSSTPTEAADTSTHDTTGGPDAAGSARDR